MSIDEGKSENPLGRWSKRKAEARAGTATPETAAESAGSESARPGGRGGAAPVAERRFVAPMLPLAEPEEGEFDYEAAPAEALEMLARRREAEAAGEAVEDEEKTFEEEMAVLTPDERDAIKDLPAVDSLTKESDFTPFFADNIPDFLKKAAYKALWMSNPLFNFRDGLNDYDENFRISEKILSAANGDFDEMPGRQEPAKDESASEDAGQTAERKADETNTREATETAADKPVAPAGDAGDDDPDDELGDGEDDLEA